MSSFTLFSAVTLVLLSFFTVANALEVNCPSGPIALESTTTFSWTGSPNFSWEVYQFIGDGSQKVLASNSDTSDTQAAWPVSGLSANSDAVFLVVDSTSQQAVCTFSVVAASSASSASSSPTQSPSSATPSPSTSSALPSSTSVVPSSPAATTTTVVQPSTTSKNTQQPASTTTHTSASPVSPTIPSSPTPSPSPSSTIQRMSTIFSTPPSATPTESSTAVPLPSFGPDGTPQTPATAQQDSMSKDRSIPYIIGIMVGIAVLAGLGFAWRFYRIRRRLAASKIYDMSAPKTGSSFGGGPASWSYGKPLDNKEISIAPPERRWTLEENDMPLLGVSGAGTASSTRVGTPAYYPSSTGYPLDKKPRVSSEDGDHASRNANIGLSYMRGSNNDDSSTMDSARASSIMLPPVVHSSRFESTPPMPASHADGHESPASSTSTRSSYTRPASPIVLEDTVFDLPLPGAPGSTLHTPFSADSTPRTRQSFPIDARYSTYSIASTVATSPHARRPISPLPPLPRSARSADEYPTTPTTPFYPASYDQARDSGAFVRQMMGTSPEFIAVDLNSPSQNPFENTAESTYAPSTRASVVTTSTRREMEAARVPYVSELEMQRLARIQASHNWV